MNTGEIIDRMYELREEYRALNKQVDELKAQYSELEAQLLNAMDEQGTTLSRAGRASAGISEQTVGVVNDWEAFGKFLIENDALYMLQRRVNNGPFREWLDAEGDAPPGTHAITVRSINLRKV